MKLDLIQLLTFFDEAPKDSCGHATAIVGVIGEDFGAAVVKHYMVRSKLWGDINSVEIDHEKTPTTGAQSGFRLDRWVLVSHENGATLYQVEIKNWSAHAIGGKRIAINVSEEDLVSHRRDRWKNQFTEKGVPNRDSSRKVLVKMVPPYRWAHYPITPMICFWDAMHPDGKSDPFFEVGIEFDAHDDTKYCREFKKLAVFSMSNYIRLLVKNGESVIDVELPNCEKRLDWLGRFTQNSGNFSLII